MVDNSKNNESFIRWQAITMNQLSYAINLILGLSVAALGFGMSIILNDKFNPIGLQKVFFDISLFLLFVSVALGVWCTINRLKDFRATTKISAKRDKEGLEDEVKELRVLTNNLGERTWCIFRWQIVIFGVGVLSLVIAVTFSFGDKLL